VYSPKIILRTISKLSFSTTWKEIESINDDTLSHFIRFIMFLYILIVREAEHNTHNANKSPEKII